MKQMCVNCAGNTASKLKLQNFTSYPDANINKFLMGV